jgi:hypothetical protein
MSAVVAGHVKVAADALADSWPILAALGIAGAGTNDADPSARGFRDHVDQP